ncbi:Glucooligosaccharide oxidase [Pleomassaria siparia CBS 279.74]|uniref:Glucooligosaccharide oxidase n=1 Tax=Pleomassaria siparia CBS 279.74 TaxID=1314801 RepID=A0A6G1KLV8_9PLEO|nr:Glucooligosaccharide oxidase [Pleomassaria siparia CBS 279.74]
MFLYYILSSLLLLLSLASALPSPLVAESSKYEHYKRQNASAELGACLSAAGVQTSLPSTSTWSTDTLAWCSRVSPVPSVVVFPKSETEVSAALKCAAASGTKVTTLGGNRSFHSAGFGRNDGAMVVNLVNMKVLEYDETTELLTYGGPVTISEAAGHMWTNYQRALPHGRCPDVGMTGVSASGFGTLSRAKGTVLDNVAKVRVALADGSILNASETENEDLFWAVRGAASSMGVVLTFSIKTMAPPSSLVSNYTIAFPAGYVPTQQQNVDALLGAQAWAQSKDNDDLLSVRFGLRASSQLAGFYYGTPEQFAAVSKTLLSYLPANMTVSSGSEDFWASEDLATPGIAAKSQTTRRYFYISSVTIPSSTPLDNNTAWSLFSSTVYVGKLSDATASGFVDIWGGEYTASIPSDLSAWKHDDNLLLVRWDMRSSAANVSFSDASLQKVRKAFYEGFVDEYKTAGGTPGGFTTYRDAEWTLEESAEYLYGSEGYEKLKEVKTKFDPGMLFNTDPQAIPALAQ